MKTFKLRSENNACHVCENNLGGFLSEKSRTCRVCGEVVCKDCSKQKRPFIPVLDETPNGAVYDPKTESVHVCDKCIKDPYTLFIEGDPSNDRLEIQELFEFAKQAVIESNKNFPVSPSRQHYYKDFNPALHATKKAKEAHLEETDTMLRPPEYKDTVIPNQDILKHFEDEVRRCLKISVANCEEMCYFCYLMFHYARMTNNVTTTDFGLHRVVLGDHIFLLIAPPGGMLPRRLVNTAEIRSLRRNRTIVCDPWLKSVFFFVDQYSYMGDQLIEPKRGFDYIHLRQYHTRYTSLEELYPGGPNQM
ncbi:MAG: hypothetical protein GY750_04355 [Lentisphaerae bacterium]|nr:hypothetical protein [Lentisphaerota bacterium]MCP4100643.1 hypothetical protein [Lentisphaerota bacterium]